ncbi:MAG TPA: adenosylcobinamide-GDP ribazoletransferase [Alphaproteobacteria bacterium]|jgi:adenosylcobinamide-GDP ribazoletransferase
MHEQDPPRAVPAAGPLGQFAAAWTLLSRLPWPFAVPRELGAIGRGVWAFPIMGALLGALGGGVYWLGRELGLPALVAAALAIGFLAFATGGLHEDGLADTADGFGGGRTREQKLAIMRDSRIGAYGVLALVIATLLRVGALAAMAGPAGFAALIAAAALGRGFTALPMSLLPPARADGLGRAAGRAPGFSASLALILAIAAATLAAASYALAWRAVGYAVTASFFAVLLVSLLAQRHIGGVTGDVLGAAILAGEAAALIALAS